MTNKQKQLLLKDLCARLPYGVKGLHRDEVQSLYLITIDGCYQINEYGAWFDLSDIDFKPYLRPLSSMTEEEYNEYENYVLNEKDELIKFCNSMNFYNRKHFDYRGLIPMELALVAPEDMYK